MPRVTPLPESEATDKVAQTYERIRELLEVEAVPPPFLLYGRVPAFLQDFFMNFKKFVHGEGKLDARTRSVIALAVSASAGSDDWAEFFVERCRRLGLSSDQIAEILAIASTNYMYNTFFKFRELSGTDLFSGMSVGLRAHTFAGTSWDERTVELINIAISDINSCRPCVSGHVEKARQLGIADEAILEAIQCAAVVLAGAQFLKAAGV
jgi:alkyl hydroperoxide reductase subunit D